MGGRPAGVVVKDTAMARCQAQPMLFACGGRHDGSLSGSFR